MAPFRGIGRFIQRFRGFCEFDNSAGPFPEIHVPGVDGRNFLKETLALHDQSRAPFVVRSSVDLAVEKKIGEAAHPGIRSREVCLQGGAVGRSESRFVRERLADFVLQNLHFLGCETDVVQDLENSRFDRILAQRGRGTLDCRAAVVHPPLPFRADERTTASPAADEPPEEKVKPFRAAYELAVEWQLKTRPAAGTVAAFLQYCHTVFATLQDDALGRLARERYVGGIVPLEGGMK